MIRRYSQQNGSLNCTILGCPPDWLSAKIDERQIIASSKRNVRSCKVGGEDKELSATTGGGENLRFLWKERIMVFNCLDRKYF